jgi:hypothetical protein
MEILLLPLMLLPAGYHHITHQLTTPHGTQSQLHRSQPFLKADICSASQKFTYIMKPDGPVVHDRIQNSPLNPIPRHFNQANL